MVSPAPRISTGSTPRGAAAGYRAPTSPLLRSCPGIVVTRATGLKAIAISTAGEVRARAERGYPLSIPQPGWAEQDPEDWCDAAQSALDDLSVEAASIGLSGQMHGLVVLDGGDRVLRPAIL